MFVFFFFFFSSRRRHTRYWRDWSSDVCSSDLFSILRYFDNFWLALLLTPLLVGGIGLLIELVFLQRWHGRGRHLEQVLFTLGLALITTDLTRAQWGAFVEKVPEPAQLAGRVLILSTQFPVYRLSIVVFGVLLG